MKEDKLDISVLNLKSGLNENDVVCNGVVKLYRIGGLFIFSTKNISFR